MLFSVLIAGVALWALQEWRIDEEKRKAIIERAQALKIDAERREAVQARQEAELARELAEERTKKLLKQFGWENEKLAEGGVDQNSVQQSLKADQEIQQAVQLGPRENRKPMPVQYFPKDVDENKVESALRELGFTLDKRRAFVSDIPTNSIWYGAPVNIEDVKLVALTLIRAGVQMKAIRPFPDGSPRKNAALIQVGADTSVVDRPPLTVEAIRNASGFTSDG